MRCVVSVANLRNALGLVSRVASSKSTLPVLGNVLFKAENNHIYLTTTDLTIGMHAFVGAKVTEEGEITLPARMLHEYISTLQEETVEIAYKENKVTLKSKTHQTIIGGTPAEDFPELPQVDKINSFILQADDLKNSFTKTIHSASNDTTKPALSGVHIESGEQNIRFATTDGYRLSEYMIKQNDAPEFSITIPIKSASELNRILPENGSITIALTQQLLEVTTPEVTFVTRLIEAPFPKYQSLIPKRTTTSVVLSKKDLLGTIKLASIFAREQAGSTTLSTNEETQELTIKTQATQTGQNTSVIPAEVVGAADITINSRYISDALQQIESARILLGINENMQPCLVRGDKDTALTQIIMPLKG